MNREIPKAYSAMEHEDAIYQKWIESGYFNPDVCVSKGVTAADAQPFSVMMPPPNVTGILHLGHAFEQTLQDIKVRYARMKGYKTLWVPGVDHAAVATQAKVEKLLLDTEGIENPREELGREKLLERIREFADESRDTIVSQVKKMGASCDWSRFAYTFDETRSKTVNTLFKKMFEDGLIYQGYRVVNWSVAGQCTCSDDELESKTRMSKLYTFKYSADFPITIATTRPETKLGDTAVAVNPEDERYNQYIGQTFTVDVGAAQPLEIKIIGDDAVDPTYGTGAVGVTPAHSSVDFEMYERHDIKLIQVIGEDGKMTEAAGADYVGLSALEAREKFVAWLDSSNLLEKTEEIEQNVSTSDRFKDIVEAIPMTQWFVAVNKKIPGTDKSLKDLMKDVVTSGLHGDADQKITINPERFNKTYFSWIDNLRDWCISRQIWWGHRIPIWYDADGTPTVILPEEEANYDMSQYTQDEDTLDTWFSSGTWTFSTLGWPEETDDFKTYHPTTWMQMGYEILFFWMARMILMTTYGLNCIPFKDVYIHGMVRDKDGQKFSKSLGNGIEPVEVIEQYGTDALRTALMSDGTPGNDIRFSYDKVETHRNLMNKTWNISRYILTSVEEARLVEELPAINSLADKWIISELMHTISETTRAFEEDRFAHAFTEIKNFTRHKFADWYLEIAKVEGDKDDLLLYILQNILKLWHPFAPFQTEYIWSLFAQRDEDHLLMVQKWPEMHAHIDEQAQADFALLQDAIVGVRNVRTEKKVAPAKKIDIVINSGSAQSLLKENADVLKQLARIENIEYADTAEKSVPVVINDTTLFVKLDSLVSEADKDNIRKQIDDVSAYIDALNKKLSNEQFVSNAPEAVVAGERKKLADAEDKKASLEAQL